MGFSKLPNHIRGRILVERESHLTDHCAFVVSVEHTYLFKQVHTFVDLKITTVKLGKLRPCLPKAHGSSMVSRALTHFVSRRWSCWLLSL